MDEKQTDTPNIESIKAKAAEAGLIPVQAFIPAEKPKRKGSAERVARMRERQKEAGMVQTTAPAAVVEAVKDAGGWDKWQPNPPEPVNPLAGFTGWRAWVIRIALWLVKHRSE
jgi:hypothetical protein